MKNIPDDEGLSQIEKICSDERFPECYKRQLKYLKGYFQREGYFTPEQEKTLQGMFSFYGGVVKTNKKIREKQKEKVSSTLEGLLEITKAMNGSNVLGYRGSLKLVLEEIKEGRYFWNSHLKPGLGLTRLLLTHKRRNDKEKRKIKRVREYLKKVSGKISLSYSGDANLADILVWKRSKRPDRIPYRFFPRFNQSSNY